MFNGKNKAITFSYDDGVTQDIRLIEIFNKYNLKVTFNLNSGLLGQESYLIRNDVKVNHTKNKPEDIKFIYEGHEVAAHTLTHPNLVEVKEENEIIRQVEQDRLNLSELVNYEVVGMAYPGGGKNNDERVAEIIKNNTGIKYARTNEMSKTFDISENLFQYTGSLYHHIGWNGIFKMAEEFFSLQSDSPKIFYVWGHAYEFDIYPERWNDFEEFCRLISNRSDIYYGTNKDVLGKL